MTHPMFVGFDPDHTEADAPASAASCAPAIEFQN